MEDLKREGRNTFAFWVLIIMLFALTLANLALTMTIISVLRFGRGMEYMELVPEANSIKFFGGDVDLDRIQKRDGLLEGFADVPVTISGDVGAVAMNLVYRNGHTQHKFQMDQNETHLRNINFLELRHPTTRELLFTTTTKPTYLLAPTKNLRANAAIASKVTAPVDENLQLQSRGKLVINGAEGIKLEGQAHLWSADHIIQLKTVNGSILLSGFKGTHWLSKALSNGLPEKDKGIRLGDEQFKICVCMPQGRLFRVSVPRGMHGSKVSCTDFDLSSSLNPCI